MREKLKPSMCRYCPLRGEPAECVVLRTGHVRICEWVDPDSPHFRAGSEPFVASLAKSSGVAYTADPSEIGGYQDRAELEIEEKRETARREKERKEREEKEGKVTPGNPFTPEPTEPGKPLAIKLISDEDTHALVYEGARDCPHKKQEIACCGPVDRCGKNGMRPGMLVTIRDCYPCTATRLGIEVK